MEGAVKDDPVKFAFETLVVVIGIVPHPIDTDVNFPRYGCSGLRQIKSDDIGIIIVVQVVSVDLQEVFIAAEYKVERIKRFFLLLKEPLDKAFTLGSLRETEPFYQVVELNIIGSFAHHFQNS